MQSCNCGIFATPEAAEAFAEKARAEPERYASVNREHLHKVRVECWPVES